MPIQCQIEDEQVVFHNFVPNDRHRGPMYTCFDAQSEGPHEILEFITPDDTWIHIAREIRNVPKVMRLRGQIVIPNILGQRQVQQRVVVEDDNSRNS